MNDKNKNQIIIYSESEKYKNTYKELKSNPKNWDGKHWLAPNGKVSNLKERQYIIARTSTFKKYFGDWEKQIRIRKIKESKYIQINFNNEYKLNSKSTKKYMLDNLRYEYKNINTNETIFISRLGTNEVLSHDRYNLVHLKSIIAIPQMIENSIFIDEIENEKNNNKFDKYRYYVCGIELDGEKYTAKIVVGVKKGMQYYDHSISNIEKEKLTEISDNQSVSINQLHKNFDKRLVEICQVNSLKMVDENGEPEPSYINSFTKRLV